MSNQRAVASSSSVVLRGCMLPFVGCLTARAEPRPTRHRSPSNHDARRPSVPARC